MSSAANPRLASPSGSAPLHEILVFLKRHWPHALLIFPGALIVTMLHEAAHAIAVLCQGGTVLRFVWLPSVERWGYVTYDFPAGAPHSTLLISIAPYLLWLSLAAAVFILAFRGPAFGYGKASLLFCWLFVVPMADIANAAFPYLNGRDNDFRSAFGPPSLSVGLMFGLLGIATLVVGYLVQRRLYRDGRLSAPSYLVLSSAVVVILLALTT